MNLMTDFWESPKAVLIQVFWVRSYDNKHHNITDANYTAIMVPKATKANIICKTLQIGWLFFKCQHIPNDSVRGHAD